MFQQFFNWKTALALVAILIASGTIFYSQYLARKIAKEERQKVEQWVEASNVLLNADQEGDTRLPLKIIQDNDDVPIIYTNEVDSIIDYINLDTAKLNTRNNYLEDKLQEFKSDNPPIVWTDPSDSTKINRYYYGHTSLLNEVQFYPIIQLAIIGLFILITLLALRSSYRSVQNQVWAGMAKETAHQLGTPLSSLEGWIEMLKQNPDNANISGELEKDLNRLRLVSDRFGKIGSKPKLEEMDIIEQVTYMIEYIRRRAPEKVIFSIDTYGHKTMPVKISGPLFDWVIENILKNALDAMEGKGAIQVGIKKSAEDIIIEITDSGKGISKQNLSRIFKPGFTTKKRGWGLGLSLSKRIIEKYHMGKLIVKSSEPGKGTTFRIVLHA
ncbi:MAG: HAMP domain-containing histidine kinase [Chitinophagaceae bacterium]|nr:HAMP domain-containing histidine kinase [Chitinophagaceae bacterium]